MIRWSFKNEAQWMLWLTLILPLAALVTLLVRWLGEKL
jgi:hypothetical protein